MEHYEQKRIENLRPLPIFAKSSILDVWLGSQCASDELSNLPHKTDFTHFVPSPLPKTQLIRPQTPIKYFY